MTPNDPIKAYTRAGLHLYDALVMGAFAKHVWRCPPSRFVAHYRKHLTSNHAEVGVGIKAMHRIVVRDMQYRLVSLATIGSAVLS